ncbi:MAG: hypothetical protein R3Y11_01825 [Pseudomonadota bacterium]
MSINPTSLIGKLLGEYREAEQRRLLHCDRWIEDICQYKGKYDSETASRLDTLGRSKVFHRVTTTKVNTMTARLMDLLFPQRSRNWSVEPTPNPSMPDEIIMQALGPKIQERAAREMQALVKPYQEQNILIDNVAMEQFNAQAMQRAIMAVNTPQARLGVAKDRAAAMQTAIDDQLKELSVNGILRKSWQAHCRAVIKSACLYGTGILKGPLVERVEEKRFTLAEDETGGKSWQEQVVKQTLRPHYEAVSIWDIFPDPDAIDTTQLRYVWQAHVKTDKELLELSNFPGFDGEAIREHMRAHDEGDAQLAQWEQSLRELDTSNLAGGTLKNRYRVYERWGFLTGQDLVEAGLDIEDERLHETFASNVWIIGNSIIKAVVNPLEGIDIPYFFYSYEKDDTSFWSEGIASLLRYPQSGINSAVRSMQDNSAASSGPVYGINVQALAAGEDPMQMVANRIFLFDKPQLNLNNAFQAVTVPSAIEHNLALSNFWDQAADEISTPRFNTGDGNIAGAGKTASGLSMLMGASNILLKDHVKEFDDCIVAPFLRAMFMWNMQWNDDEDIKGDYSIVATGSQSLIAKEVRAQQVPALINYLGIPEFKRLINVSKLLEVALEQTDLPSDRILLSEEEAKEAEHAQAMAMAEANVAALMQELTKQGLSPEQIQQQLVMLLMQSKQLQDQRQAQGEGQGQNGQRSQGQAPPQGQQGSPQGKPQQAVA